MSRLKTFHIMVAAFAVASALGPLPAFADEFTSESYPTELTGHGTNEQFGTTFLSPTCQATTYDATMNSSATTLVITPTFKECSAFLATKIDTNGCVYLARLKGGSSTDGELDLACPPGNEMQITFTWAGVPKCTIDIPPQTNIGGVISFSNIGAGPTKEIAMQLRLSQLHYTHTEGTGSGLKCASGSSESGTLFADVSFTGETDNSVEPGYYLSAGFAKLKTYMDPGYTDTLTTTSGTFSCKKPVYSAEISQPVKTVTFIPTYNECVAFGFPATVDLNGCHFRLEIDQTSSTKGSIALTCPPGSEMTVTAISAGTTKCTLHVLANSTSSVKISHVGTGSTSEVTVDASFGGIEYAHTKGSGLGACSPGFASNGSFVTKSVLTAEAVGSGHHVGLSLGPTEKAPPAHVGIFLTSS